MNAFDLARQKHAKNLERKLRTQGNASVPIAKPEEVVRAPKERGPETGAFVEVKVKLPSGEFAFCLMKPAVFQNAIQSKLTRAAFINCVMRGLEPLLGGVKEI